MVEYKNVMVGVDGSKQSQAAFEKGLHVAKENGATLHLVSVINGEHYPSGSTLGYGFVDRGLYDDGRFNQDERRSGCGGCNGCAHGRDDR